MKTERLRTFDQIPMFHLDVNDHPSLVRLFWYTAKIVTQYLVKIGKLYNQSKHQRNRMTH